MVRDSNVQMLVRTLRCSLIAIRKSTTEKLPFLEQVLTSYDGKLFRSGTLCSGSDVVLVFLATQVFPGAAPEIHENWVREATVGGPWTMSIWSSWGHLEGFLGDGLRRPKFVKTSSKDSRFL